MVIFYPTEESSAAFLSLSSDGNYAISTHHGNYLVLWDIKKQKKTLLSKSANIFSASFIKGGHTFLWQDLDNNVFVQSTKGKVIKKFNPKIATYTHMMQSNLEDYFTFDVDMSIFHLKNKNIEKQIKVGHHEYWSMGKINTTSQEGSYLLTSSMGDLIGEDFPFNIGASASDLYQRVTAYSNYSFNEGTVLWSTTKNKPLIKFNGLSSASVATISPDMKYVVAGDENGNRLQWSIKTGKRSRFKRTTFRDALCYDDKECIEQLQEEMRTNLVAPDDMYSKKYAGGGGSVAVKFIDEQGHFLQFIEEARYAILYKINLEKVQAFLALGHDPQPNDYDLHASGNTIATAPKAKTLAMAQLGKSGIIVYRYNEKINDLEKIWAPDGPPPH